MVLPDWKDLTVKERTSRRELYKRIQEEINGTSNTKNETKPTKPVDLDEPVDDEF